VHHTFTYIYIHLHTFTYISDHLTSPDRFFCEEDTATRKVSNVVVITGKHSQFDM
jgi:hypothetical protein